MFTKLSVKTMKWYHRVTEAGPDFKNYFNEVLSCNYSRQIPNNTTVLPKEGTKNSFILIQKLHNKFFFCPECDDCGTKFNLNMDSEEAHIEKAYCKHALAASILETKDNIKTEILDKDIDQVFVLQEKPFPVSIVYPQTRKSNTKGEQILPGVVIRTNKMSKHRCKTCKGRDGCVHLNIFKLAQSENDLVDEFGSMRLLEKTKKTNKKN